MKQAIKDEALEQLTLDIAIGFDNEDSIFSNTRDMFSDEEDFDEDWLRETIAAKYALHQQESLCWQKPGDFDKLAGVFDALTIRGIVCLHNAGYTKQDAVGDCLETIESLTRLGIKTTGYCYYHAQDLGRAVDPGTRNLYLGFDSPDQNDNGALEIARTITAALVDKGFEVSWPGTVDQRILINHINWQKIPDNEDWSAGRVIKLLIKETKSKKPFWKFW